MARSPQRPNHRHFRTGSVLVPAFLGLAAVGLIAWGGSAVFSSSAGSATTVTTIKKARRDPAPLTDRELAVALTRFGLAAPPLSAAGLTAQEVGTVVGQARDYLSTHIQDLRDADQAWGTARGERDRLQRLVQGGKTENVQAYQAAVTALATADSQRLTVFNAVFNAAADGLDQGKLAMVQTIKANGAAWDMPTQYLAANRDEPVWVHLRDALANQRISLAQGVDPDPGEQAFLGTQSGGAVATAAANLAGLAELTAAWNAAVFH